MAQLETIVVGVAAGIGGAGACGFAFGAVLKVMGKRIDAVKALLDSKVDISGCIVKYDNIMERLHRGEGKFDALESKMSKAMACLTRLDERTAMWFYDRRQAPYGGRIPNDRRRHLPIGYWKNGEDDEKT